MASATYIIKLDTLRNHSFAGAYDDITQYVLNASWSNGLANAFDDVGAPALASFTLDNSTNIFTQDYIGTEQLNNGTFANWTSNNPDNWTVTGESGTDPEVSQVGSSEAHGGGGTGLANFYTSSAALSIAQNVLTPSVRYRVTLVIDTVANGSTGGIVIKNNGAAVSPVYHTSGLKTFYFTAAAVDFTVATDGASNVTLDNISCKPALLYAGALATGTIIQVSASFQGVTSKLYIGKIRDVSFAAGNLGTKICLITAEDPTAALSQTIYQPSLIVDATVDQGLSEMFDKATYAWPYPQSYWMLETEGASELGTTTTLFNNTLSSLSTGATSLSWLGSNADAGHGIAAQSFIQDLMACEVGGRFWFDARTEQFKFTNRNHDLDNYASSQTWYSGDATNGYDYDSASQLLYGDLVINDCTVNYQPRGAGVAGTVIWFAQDIIQLTAGQEKKITARYFDAVNNTSAKVSAIDVISPQPFKDYTAQLEYTVSVNNGTSAALQTVSRTTLPVTNVLKYETITIPKRIGRTRWIGVSIKAGATSAEITIHNRKLKRKDTHTTFVTGLRIRGTPIYTYDKRATQKQDNDSIRANGLRKKIMDLPQADNDGFAQDVAAFTVSRFKTPVSRFTHIAMVANKTDARMNGALTRRIGDRITVTDDRTFHNSDYIVIGEKHAITAGGEHTHSVTWILEPANTVIYWKLGIVGFGELGTNTRAML